MVLRQKLHKNKNITKKAKKHLTYDQMYCNICKVLLPKTAGAARRNVEQPAEESISEYAN